MPRPLSPFADMLDGPERDYLEQHTAYGQVWQLRCALYDLGMALVAIFHDWMRRRSFWIAGAVYVAVLIVLGLTGHLG